MNNKTTVKKICSLNPTKFKKMNLKKASDKYADYINYFVTKKDYSFKTFTEWLNSEI
jgi:hypothetical protein